MKTSTLLKVWVVLGLGWLLFFGPLASGRYQEEGVAASTVLTFRLLAWLLLLLSLAVALVLHVLYRRAVRRHSGEAAGYWLIDASPTVVLPGMAQGTAALGATFLLSSAPLLGIPLGAFGAFLLRRTVLRIDPQELRLWRYTQLLGVTTAPVELLVPAGKPIHLKRLDGRGVGLFSGEVLLADGLTDADALRIAEELGRELRRGVESDELLDDGSDRPALILAIERFRRLAALLVPLALLGLAVAWMIPASRSALCRLAVAPHTPFSDSIRIPDLRIAGLRCLAAQPEEENLLALLRVANTADPGRSPQVLAAAVRELRILANDEAVAAPGELDAATLGRINRWAAQRLGRQLDANGGTMAWHAVEGESHRRAVNALADEDAGVASAAWDAFGAGDLTTPEDFLWAVGPALADPRPIHFVLASDGGPPRSREERRAGYAGPVLAETVGEAVALRLWGYDGVGSAEFPPDFWSWWAGYARDRHLPPGGPGARPARR